MPTPKEMFAKRKGIALSEVKYEDFASWVGDWGLEQWISNKPEVKQKKCYAVFLLLEDGVKGMISPDKDAFTTASVGELMESTGLFPKPPSILDDEMKAFDPECWMMAYQCWKMTNDLIEQIETYKIENGQANFSCLNLSCPGLPKNLINGTITWA